MITSLVLLIRTDLLNYDSGHLFVSMSDCMGRKYFIDNKAMYTVTATNVTLVGRCQYHRNLWLYPLFISGDLAL